MKQGKLTHWRSLSFQTIQVIFFCVTKFFSRHMLHHILSLPFDGVSERIKVCVKNKQLRCFLVLFFILGIFF